MECLLWLPSIPIRRKVLRPENPPHLITSTPHKIALIRAHGVGHLLIIPFRRKFRADRGGGFCPPLTKSARPLREICVGHEWSFGKNRAGNLALLRKLGTRHDFNVIGIPPVKVNGAVVSSTAIRARIERGDFAGAAAMLGRDYTILGTVREDRSWDDNLVFLPRILARTANSFRPTAFILSRRGWKACCITVLSTSDSGPLFPAKKPSA